MRAVIQRVSRASVTVDEKVTGAINTGLLVLVGIEDADGVMNLSLQDVKGDLLLVSQFTLHASTKKGNRPSYIQASKPPVAIPLYEQFIAQLEKDLGKPIQTGIFGADMKVELVNDGPVTIWMDTKNK